MSDYGSPRPRRPLITDDQLFQFAERPTVVVNLTPLQAQRAKDGTPITMHAPTALKPESPMPVIRKELINKGSLVEKYAPHTKELPKLDPVETLGVIKSYMESKPVHSPELKEKNEKLHKSISKFADLVKKIAGKR